MILNRENGLDYLLKMNDKEISLVTTNNTEWKISSYNSDGPKEYVAIRLNNYDAGTIDGKMGDVLSSIFQGNDSILIKREMSVKTLQELYMATPEQHKLFFEIEGKRDFYHELNSMQAGEMKEFQLGSKLDSFYVERQGILFTVREESAAATIHFSGTLEQTMSELSRLNKSMDNVSFEKNIGSTILDKRVNDVINNLKNGEEIRFIFKDKEPIDVTKSGENFIANKIVNHQPEMIIIATSNQVTASIIKADPNGPLVAKDSQQWTHPLIDENLKSILMKSQGIPTENLQGKLDQTVLKYQLTQDGTLDYLAKDQININSIKMQNAPYLNLQKKIFNA